MESPLENETDVAAHSLVRDQIPLGAHEQGLHRLNISALLMVVVVVVYVYSSRRAENFQLFKLSAKAMETLNVSPCSIAKAVASVKKCQVRRV